MKFDIKNYKVYSFRLEKYPDKKIWFLKKNHFGRN